MSKQLKLHGKYGEGRFATVSDCDYESLCGYRWVIQKDYKNPNLEYVYRVSHQKKIFLHRWIIGDVEKKVVDHINRNTLDNRRENLRHVTYSESMFNRSYSKVRYCTKNNGRWQSQTRVNGKYKYLGIFDTPEEAKKKAIDYLNSSSVV